MYFVYILTNISSEVLYTGVTNDLIRRVYEHKNHLSGGFSKRYNTNKLVYYEMTECVKTAIAREKTIKNMLRSKKDKLISEFNPEWKELYDDLL